MRLCVRLFAHARSVAARDSLEVEIAGPATIADLRRAIGIIEPKLLPGLPYLSFAVNREYAADGASISEDDDIACIPPTSGG